MQQVPYFRPYLTENLFLSHESKIVEAWTSTGLYRFQDWFTRLRSLSRFDNRDLKDYSSQFYVGPILREYKLHTEDYAEGPAERVLFIKMCLFLMTKYRLLKMIPEPFRDALETYLREHNRDLLNAQKPFVFENAIDYD